MMYRVIILLVLLISAQIQAANISECDYKIQGVARTVLQILEEQPDSIEDWSGDRIYLNPERIHVSRNGVFVSNRRSKVMLEAFAVDKRGVFIRCQKEHVSKEAQDHYDRAREALIEGIGHSAAAGVSIEIAPVAVYEGYQAVESFKEAAREYNAGVECEKRGAHGG